MDAVLGIVVLIVVAVVGLLAARRGKCYALHLVDDGQGNESLVLDAHLSGQGCLFLLDTAWAGAPVLSTSYLAALESADRSSSVRSSVWSSVRARYTRTLRALAQQSVADDPAAAAIAADRATHALLARGRCRAFTSGCTMRLMGIGESRENQAHMLLCPSVHFREAGGVGATQVLLSPLLGRGGGDVFVTNPLRGSIHILTSDYLLHNGPCVIEPRGGKADGSGRLRCRVPSHVRHGYDLFPAHFVGGAFVVPMRVGHGSRVLNVVIDTGASAPLSVCVPVPEATPTHRTVHQVGVNGERVCSEVMVADVTLGSVVLPQVDVLVNSHPVEGADGYVGMGLLRCFDIYLDQQSIGFRLSGLPPARVTHAAAGSCRAPSS